MNKPWSIELRLLFAKIEYAGIPRCWLNPTILDSVFNVFVNFFP